MKIEPIIDADVFHQDIVINPVNLNAGFIQQASLFASYAGKHFEATKQLSRAKMFLELQEAIADKDIRNAAINAVDDTGKPAPKKLTEKQIESEIVRTRKVIDAQTDYNDANAIFELVKLALDAFRQRRDMLVGLGATEREERKGDLFLATRQDKPDREAIMAAARERADAMAAA